MTNFDPCEVIEARPCQDYKDNAGHCHPEWEQVAPGIECKLLATDTERDRIGMLVRLACGASYPAHSHAGEEERHLLEARNQSGLQERTAAALTKANEIVVMMEAPYVTGGGTYHRDARTNAYITNLNGERRFRVDVSNYEKTPAFPLAFDVRFATKVEVKTKLLPVSREFTHYDLLPPGGAHRSAIDGSREIWVPKTAEVVYDDFWYRDIWHSPLPFCLVPRNPRDPVQCRMRKGL